MNLFGLEVRWRKKEVSAPFWDSGLRGWYPLINEPFTGAWQRNQPILFDNLLSNATVYRCVTLIATDVAKMGIKLVEQNTKTGIWKEIESAAFSPVLRKPNDFQTRIQFLEQWMISKLTSGNTYVLKGRTGRNTVSSLHVLNPYKTKPLKAPNGDVYYQLSKDELAGQFEDNLVVPARDIIHDRMNALFDPLVGLPPIYASSLSATQSLRIQRFSDTFFANQARPSGILTAPGDIPQETADRIKQQWEGNYSDGNVGKIAVAGSGLKWEPLVINAVDAQLIEQLKLLPVQICATFGVPPFMVGADVTPSYNNIQSLTQMYFSAAIQIHCESIEVLLDEGLGLTPDYGTEFDTDNLLRMDTATQIDSLTKSVGGGIAAPNEARKTIGLPPVDGGDIPFLQQQYYPINERPATPITQPAQPQQPPQETMPPEDVSPEDTIDNFAGTYQMKKAA